MTHLKLQVIYHLNSKNEDHQDDLTSLTDAYENEIDQILKDAYTKINKFKDMIEQRKEVEKQQQAVDEFKKQHEKEKKEALDAFEAYKSRVKTGEEQLRKSYEEKLQERFRGSRSLRICRSDGVCSFFRPPRATSRRRRSN